MARDLVNGYIIACFNEGDPLDSAPAALPKGTGWEWVLPSPAIEVATLIRHLREEKGLSQQEAARLIGVPYTSYQRWEHPKKCNATMRTLSRIAEAFGRRLEVVFR